MRRFDPGYRALRRVITDGNDGELLMVHSVHRNPNSAEGRTAAAIQSLPAHEFNMLRWLSAEQIVSVAAFAGKRSSNAARGLHDPMLFVCTTTSGVIGHIQMYSNARYGYEVRCEVLCEEVQQTSTGCIAARMDLVVALLRQSNPVSVGIGAIDSRTRTD
ncbi:MAG: hypothetical protein ABI137_10725 [Antricoccus sp.]